LYYRCTTFPQLTDCVLRTDASFRAKLQRQHHKGLSPLLDLKIDLISCIPLDYMHLVLLGVFKRFLTIWTGHWSKKHFNHKLGTWERQQLEKRLQRIRLSYPQEFLRVITSFKYANTLKRLNCEPFFFILDQYFLKGFCQMKSTTISCIYTLQSEFCALHRCAKRIHM
jgi:hypothetical protein